MYIGRIKKDTAKARQEEFYFPTFPKPRTLAAIHCPKFKQTFLDLKPTILLIIGIIWIQAIRGQDTLKYNGILSNGIVYESIELYPDSTFKWENEYDLSWQEFGTYERKGNKLTLNYYIKLNRPNTMAVADSIALVNKPFRTTNYEFSDNNLYKLNDQNKRRPHFT